MTEKETVVEIQSDEPEKKAPAAWILGTRPDTVSDTVTLTLPDGARHAVPVEFIYRTREEFGEFWDRVMSSGEGDAPTDEKFSFEKMVGRTDEGDAKRTLEFVRSWGLDVELNLENLRLLFNQVAGSAAALWEAYRTAMVEGRRGN